MSRQSRPTVLVIDDDEASRLSLHVVLGAEFEVLTSGDGPSALALLRLYGADVLLLNLLMPGMSGLEALSDIKALYPDLQVIVVTPLGDTRIVVESVRRGAEDYLTKPVNVQRLKAVLSRVPKSGELRAEIGQMRDELRHLGRFGRLVGRSAPMQDVYDKVARVAPTEATVLVVGEIPEIDDVVSNAARRRGA